jgi:hypothetical protein
MTTDLHLLAPADDACESIENALSLKNDERDEHDFLPLSTG